MEIPRTLRDRSRRLIKAALSERYQHLKHQLAARAVVLAQRAEIAERDAASYGRVEQVGAKDKPHKTRVSA